jgi:hypothetical protein
MRIDPTEAVSEGGKERKEGRPMKDALEKLGVPIVLMGSLWGAVGVVLDAFKVINERRDLAFKLVGECGKCADKVLTPQIVYLTNMVPLTTGLVLFLIVVTAVMIRIPHFAQLQDEVFHRRMVFTSRLLATPLVFTIIGFALGGAFDFYYLFVERIH